MRNGDYYGNEYGGGEYAGWTAFLAGAFVGAGLALLFAPQSGPELRGLLSNYAGRARDQMRERGREAWDTAKERGKEYMEKGQEAVQQAGRAAREFTQSAQETTRGGGGGEGSRNRG